MKHGRGAYARGCRCEACTAAQRDYMRDWYRSRRSTTAVDSKACDACGATFTPMSDSPKFRFCSRACQLKASRPYVEGRARKKAARLLAAAARGTAGANLFVAAPSGEVIEAAVPAEYWSDVQKSALRRAHERGDNEGVVAALLANTTPSGECMLWIRQVDNKGYPKLKLAGRSVAAHRVMAEAVHGPLHGQPVHHKCATPTCIAPAHLQPVSERENTAEMLERNWYRKRIAELEQALAEVVPTHPLVTNASATNAA